MTLVETTHVSQPPRVCDEDDGGHGTDTSMLVWAMVVTLVEILHGPCVTRTMVDAARTPRRSVVASRFCASGVECASCNGDKQSTRLESGNYCWVVDLCVISGFRYIFAFSFSSNLRF